MTTSAAPNRLASRALARKSSSPSFSEIELTIGLPCTQRSPAWMAVQRELSTMIGSVAASGSVPRMFRNVVIASTESRRSASMFTSRMFAPPRTCSSATSVPPWKSFPSMSERKRAEPVTFVRSPIATNVVPSKISNGSSPAKRVSGRRVGTLRGGSPRTASTIAFVCSGVVPQQPPTTFTSPASPSSLSSRLVSWGCSS